VRFCSSPLRRTEATISAIRVPFYFCNRKARNAIRHSLTNYEEQWAKINRGVTGDLAYSILRDRVDELVLEAYPQFAEGIPEVTDFSG
jgi:hypothetical protein